MALSTFPRLLITSLLVAPLALGAAGCGGGQGDVKTANVKPGAMPEGGDWKGVFYSPLYGYLHIETDGDTAVGAWRTAAGDAYGELNGKTDGNLLRYDWKERRIGAVGADAVKEGKGYFLYKIPKEGEAHQIQGEWGLGKSDAGNTWEAVKQKNMPPDLKAVQPDEYEGRVSGGGWDEGEGSGEGEGSKEGGGEETPKEDKEK
ncbi:MAG TPA: hypothetical protein VFZ53_06825 [Polyangiaceae bacterium]